MVFCRFDKHMHTLFRITHSAPFNISIQALVLIEKVSSANQVSYLRNILSNNNPTLLSLVNIRPVLSYSLRFAIGSQIVGFFQTSHVPQLAF